ncbi:MAG: hypothetical protein N2504_03195 [candidate division WOR-3 bacterium]|nr:hypothetical protein [candidate division WOR-3 bacterium]MCX7947576.1 hypothetical protein [candidate division WOR-3 bacterium]MDW8150461.1 hypothetical protein [candidate division WOR-3 bacterium]
MLIGISKSLNLNIKSIAKGILLNQFYLIYSAIPMLCFYFYEIKNYILLFGSIIVFFLFPIVLYFLSKKYEFSIKLSTFFVLLTMFLFMWLLVGLSLYFFILSLNREISLFYSLLIFPISYNIGILSLIAPAGIGVREGVMIFMLMKFFDIDLSNKISILFRIFNLIIELILTLIGYILYQTDKK